MTIAPEWVILRQIKLLDGTVNPVKIRQEIHFLLNEEAITAEAFACDLTLLDYLRINRRLTGTKEGCAEGDCGACTVLVGRLSAGKLRYQTVNACICFLATLDGCHIVTIEHLTADKGTLHPIQQAMVDCHGSQCGFCTPGIVMSLYGLFLATPEPDLEAVERALQGNLCRCTGYQPIVDAAIQLSNSKALKRDPLMAARAKTTRRLKALQDGNRVEIHHARGQAILPGDLNDLARLRKQYPNSTIVAGATDVGLWVTKHFASISPALFIRHLDELATITKDRKGINVGANVSYSDAWSVLAKHFPSLDALWNRIGGEQVRNMGTLGGNIANGSPIGDTPPALIALGASVVLRKGNRQRRVALEKFFIEYGKQDLRPGEFVQSIFIPWLRTRDHFAAYKISKRRDEDITAVCGAFRISTDTRGKITEAVIAFGGMAGTPARAKQVERALIGHPLDEAAVGKVIPNFEKDFAPLTDWRASAQYRMRVAQNLLRRFMLERQGEVVQLERNVKTGIGV